VFGKYGDLASTIKVFVPESGQPYPRFRFPPNASTPGGLRTNRYGFRGLDFEPIKHPDTIRIAFLGASTTIADHSFPLSYPDHFGYWLNLWLKANGLSLTIETINAGREGIGSTDIAAVLRDEVLPLKPDYVIYYEGANQIGIQPQLLRPPVSTPPPGQSFMPPQLVRHSNVANVSDQFYRTRVLPLVRQWRRPSVDLVFPAGIDEFLPDIERADLPVNLATILGDLRHMADLTRQAGGRFLVSSFIWLNGSEPGIEVPDARNREIISNIDRVF
jgi:lysophospholipase L1-like esterase